MKGKPIRKRNNVWKLFLVAVIVAAVAPATFAHGLQRNTKERSARAASTQVSAANNEQYSSYLEIKRSYVRAYPGWQKKTIALLKSKGFVAFNGYPKNQLNADHSLSVATIVKTPAAVSPISPVYIGPYQNNETAERKITEILAALKPLIDREKKNDELHNRYLFLIGVLNVSR